MAINNITASQHALYNSILAREMASQFGNSYNNYNNSSYSDVAPSLNYLYGSNNYFGSFLMNNIMKMFFTLLIQYFSQLFSQSMANSKIISNETAVSESPTVTAEELATEETVISEDSAVEELATEETVISENSAAEELTTEETVISEEPAVSTQAAITKELSVEEESAVETI